MLHLELHLESLPNAVDLDAYWAPEELTQEYGPCTSPGASMRAAATKRTTPACRAVVLAGVQVQESTVVPKRLIATSHTVPSQRWAALSVAMRCKGQHRLPHLRANESADASRSPLLKDPGWTLPRAWSRMKANGSYSGNLDGA